MSRAEKQKKKFTPREVMEMVLEEARLSMPEHTEKADPLVGAILTTSQGELLAKAHRGELRIGEHCEFTLIERKLRDQNLNDCILYCTLEPCTDESRNAQKGKRGCATHIVKARLAQVYVGIEDPNPKIAGQGIQFLKDNDVTVHSFDKDLQESIRSENVAFIKEMEEEAKRTHISIREKKISPMELVKPGMTIRNLSDEALRKFSQLAQLPTNYPSEPFNAWALEFGLLNKVSTDKELRPTTLGLLLFGERPALYAPQAVFKTEFNYGGGEPEIRDFEDPLVFQLPKIIDHVKDKGLKMTINREQAERRAIPEFPIDVIREAVANAIIHRDYTIEGATNFLYIDRDKIIVQSPGGVVGPITIEDLQQLKASWFSRNAKIMFVFNQMLFAEQRGKGISSMKKLPSLGYPLPTFEMKAGNLVVTFARTRMAIAEGKMSEQEYREWLYIQANEPITRIQFEDQFQLPSKTAQNHLARLIEIGSVYTVGKAKTIKYFSKKI
jgi:ATP-dependent DNA helicase RecG